LTLEKNNYYLNIGYKTIEMILLLTFAYKIKSGSTSGFTNDFIINPIINTKASLLQAYITDGLQESNNPSLSILPQNPPSLILAIPIITN
jgi:hypothetical protein